MSDFDELKQSVDELKNEISEYKKQAHEIDMDYTYIRMILGGLEVHVRNIDEVLGLRIRKIAEFVSYPKPFGGVPLSEELKAEREALVITSSIQHQPCPKCGKQPICRFTCDAPDHPDRYPDYMVRCPDDCLFDPEIRVFCDSPEEGFRSWDKFIIEKFGDKKENKEEEQDG